MTSFKELEIDESKFNATLNSWLSRGQEEEIETEILINEYKFNATLNAWLNGSPCALEEGPAAIKTISSTCCQGQSARSNRRLCMTRPPRPSKILFQHRRSK
eukprot:gnl/MRDRNA2_/MRDRNA2_105890_c0_seq1.p2 gnl/MRDRNA2_/MRDRNA2_105890_c0~~gnl/MRDRNA2_/MRDRNA2_105890_c0_seq1.p2  ORF type:complete len:102 (+),score=13.08 gnl/MRDRNA2_/MRDRNA2_105890_c0_seq1:119-424(+)